MSIEDNPNKERNGDVEFLDLGSSNVKIDLPDKIEPLHTLPSGILEDSNGDNELDIYDYDWVDEIDGTVEVKMGLSMRSAKELVNSRFEIPHQVPTFVIDVEKADAGVVLECFPVKETVRVADGSLRTAEDVREQLL